LPGSTTRDAIKKLVKEKAKPTPKGRVIGPAPEKSTDPKISEAPIERLGAPAVDTSKVAEYSGVEDKRRGDPESVIPKVDKQRARATPQAMDNTVGDAPVTKLSRKKKK
jgi:hypothetical protein